MRAKHGTTSLNELESTNTFRDLEDNLPQTLAQSPQGSSQNGVQFEAINSPDPIDVDFAISPGPFGMFSDEL